MQIEILSLFASNYFYVKINIYFNLLLKLLSFNRLAKRKNFRQNLLPRLDLSKLITTSGPQMKIWIVKLLILSCEIIIRRKLNFFALNTH